MLSSSLTLLFPSQKLEHRLRDKPKLLFDNSVYLSPQQSTAQSRRSFSLSVTNVQARPRRPTVVQPGRVSSSLLALQDESQRAYDIACPFAVSIQRGVICQRGSCLARTAASRDRVA
eukprot:6210011-Pleurochrysis_carterae.AAC.1